MFFNLTDDLASSILFSMEDKTSSFLIDAENCTVVDLKSFEGDAFAEAKDDLETEKAEVPVADDDRYYSLPVWTSGDGYQMLEDFANNLHNPLAREELRTVLVSGRGVFRNFKNVLKSYPEVERKWHFFKDARMRERMMEWYNGLRESWGLERLEEGEVFSDEETDELLQDDFEFYEYDSLLDRNDIDHAKTLLTEEMENRLTEEFDDSCLGMAAASVWRKMASVWDENEKNGCICRTQTGDFIGCVLFSLCLSTAEKSATLSDFFVLQNFRGLGIAKELISRCLANLKESGIRWVIIENIYVPEYMESYLDKLGFRKQGFLFVANLNY